MRKILFSCLFAVLLMGALAAHSFSGTHAFAVSHATSHDAISASDCADSDYTCGYIHGFAEGRTAEEAGLCNTNKSLHAHHELTPSEQGFKDAFEHYCPA